ncbi:MAG: hypothetical protein H0W73_17115, partial [Bacteroidetes bacterium]|nr:hypothetical protein [Bacteroidota bacterium]
MINKISFFVIFNLLLGFSAFAAHEKGSNRMYLSNYSAGNNQLLLQDDKIAAVNLLTSLQTPTGFFDFSYKNRVILGIDKEITSIGSASTSLLANKDYSVRVILTLTYNKLIGS